MSLSTQTKFLLDAAFTMAASNAGHDQITIWLNLAEQSHGGEPTPAEWAEVRDLLVDRFPELAASRPFVVRYLSQKAQEPHPTCGCGSHGG